MKSSESRSQIVFLEVIEKDLSEANSESIKALALAIWYENFVPEVASICDLQQVKRAGYLLERLTAFHCVTPVVRQSLKEKIKFLEVRASEEMQLLPLSYVVNNNRTLIDPLAQRWHLSDSFRVHIQSLLPYQTRHYKYNRDN
jgi:hypothetical protein